MIFRWLCRQRLELMRHTYSEDSGPSTPEAKEELFRCLVARHDDPKLTLGYLLPSRLVLGPRTPPTPPTLAVVQSCLMLYLSVFNLSPCSTLLTSNSAQLIFFPLVHELNRRIRAMLN